MAWESVRVLDSDFPVGYTENDYYFTENRTSSRSGSEGGFSDITFVLSFSLMDYSGSSGDSYFYNQPAGDYYLVGDSNAGIFVRKTGAAQSNSGEITVKASYNGQEDSGSTQPENLSSTVTVRSNYSGLYMQFSIICGINEETHKGTIFTYRKWNGWMGSNNDYAIKYCDYNRYTNSEVAYNLIRGIMPVLYNWQSVSSVSGRTGTLQLVTLDSESINDGEPVSGAAISVFNQQPTSENNIKDLADAYGSEEESSAVDVIVDYKVTLPPGGIFSLLKLIAKKGSVPQDASDGDKIIDISPTKTKNTVTGLDENSTYYFKIFAEDSNGNTSESDEKHCSTGIKPIEPSNEVITVIAKAYSDGYQEKVTATKEEN